MFYFLPQLVDSLVPRSTLGEDFKCRQLKDDVMRGDSENISDFSFDDASVADSIKRRACAGIIASTIMNQIQILAVSDNCYSRFRVLSAVDPTGYGA